MLIEPEHPQLSISRQCALIGLSRASYYHTGCAQESEENLRYMRLIDEQYLVTPFFGSRQLARWLVRQGYEVNRKRVQRLYLHGVHPPASGPPDPDQHGRARTSARSLRSGLLLDSSSAPCGGWPCPMPSRACEQASL